MNLEEIKTAVEKIKAMGGDDEAMHASEDGLHVRFIEFIAEQGPPDLQEMAKEILKTEEMPFSRHCA